MISRRFTVALISLGVLGGACVAAFSPVVRYKAAQAASQYGAELTIEDVVPRLSGVRLRGVDVTFADVPSVRVHLAEVEVAYGEGGRKLVLRDGLVAAVGARDLVLRQAEAWRSHHVAPETGTGSGTHGSRGELDLRGLRFSWTNSATSPTESLTASDLSIARAEGRVTVSAGEARIFAGGTSLSVNGGRVELLRREGAYRLVGLSAVGVDAQVSLPENKPPAGADSPVVNLDPPSLPPSPPVNPKRRGGHAGPRASASAVVRADVSPPAPAEPAKPPVPRVAPEQTVAYRAAIVHAAQGIDALLDPSAMVHLQGVRARIRRGDDALNLGPGVLQIQRAEGRLVVDLSPELRAAAPSPAGATPATAAHEEALTFRLSIPLGEGAADIAVDVNGGPIWLSSLGVHEGDFGLFDVSMASLSTRSHFVLSADGKTLSIDGESKVHALSIRSKALSDEPVAGLELAVRLKGDFDLDGNRARVAEGEVDLGAIRVVARGDYERTGDGHHVRGSFDLPLTGCQSMFDATPKGLVPKLQGMRLAGSYALRGRLDLDTARLDRGFVLDWDTANTCRIVEASAAISVERFRRPFTRTAYDPEGRPVSLETGPGTSDWVPRSAISKFMETAVLTTEDGAFPRHHGFDHEAIRNSIRENLRQRRFVRGASTISMQLAKNLYLDRGKNLSRKLQEAVLTMYLEQELTKEQLLELYLNVVEFGPMVYGVGPAARSYFSTTARDLSLGQALYLSSVMPNPKLQRFAANGEVAPAWMSYLRKLMKIARARGHLTDEELEEGLRETVVRGSPAPQRAARPINEPEPELPTDMPDNWP